MVVAEAVVAPRSSLLGRTLREVHFRTKYGLNVLAIWRGGQVLRTRLSERRLEYGDALLVQGARSRIPILRAERDLLLYGDPAESPDEAEVLPSPRLRRAAWLILGVTLVLAALRADMVAEVMLASALVMVLVGILTMDDAYEAVDWRTVFLVAGMLPVGIAMTKSGAAALMGELLLLPPDLSHREWVKFAGLDPRAFDSGKSVHKKTRISKAGNRHIRAALYFPALSAKQHDPHVKAYFQHLVDNGKKPLQAVCAIMRKLLHAIHGMLKNNEPFDNTRFYTIPLSAE